MGVVRYHFFRQVDGFAMDGKHNYIIRNLLEYSDII